MTDKVTYQEAEGGVAVLRIDDGKVNALSLDLIGELKGALDRAEDDGRAVVLLGRSGKFSAGFDMKAMNGGLDGARELLLGGAELLMRLYGFPRPVVVGCTGHAIAAGALILLSADYRVGAAGPFKVGLNETAIALRLPFFGLEIARERIPKNYLTPAVLMATLYGPEDAVPVGYLDTVVAQEEVESSALVAAAAMAALPPKAFAGTKKRMREPTLQLIRETLVSDMNDLAGAFG